ncbi:hypothetical protein J0X14_17720 [Muricauda sp. CAU 1633]|uniref:STM3941 family protein n=1 Tax=Allomuricauda sp. CAU 1633 TaxID=2816036 RepID=UPI001A8F415F|nr:STM3941 family protein [Muricauda sp. CAU 1633]MBO0324153.1 hypothetical protein [Muricauda sp. CAU 1633]
MESIEIFSSKKKSFLLLIGSLIFVGLGIWFVLEANSLSDSLRKSPLLIRGIGVVSILFFGLGIYAGIKGLIANRLMLIISPKGLNVDPSKSMSDFIGWNKILGFNEINIHGTKIIIINVENPTSWVEKEENALRRQLMKYNVENYNSPFNISANGLALSHTQLKEKLNLYFNTYKS